MIRNSTMYGYAFLSISFHLFTGETIRAAIVKVPYPTLGNKFQV